MAAKEELSTSMCCLVPPHNWQSHYRSRKGSWSTSNEESTLLSTVLKWLAAEKQGWFFICERNHCEYCRCYWRAGGLKVKQTQHSDNSLGPRSVWRVQLAALQGSEALKLIYHSFLESGGRHGMTTSSARSASEMQRINKGEEK